MAKLDASVEIEGTPSQPSQPPGSEIDKEIEGLVGADVLATTTGRVVGGGLADGLPETPETPTVPDTSTLEAEDPDDALTGTGRTDISSPGTGLGGAAGGTGGTGGQSTSRGTGGQSTREGTSKSTDERPPGLSGNRGGGFGGIGY